MFWVAGPGTADVVRLGVEGGPSLGLADKASFTVVGRFGHVRLTRCSLAW